jgi:hypothetical protein
MTLSNLGFASGISSLMIVLIGWALGLYLVKRYLATPDKNTLALAVILISVGSVWLAISVNFLLTLLGQPFLEETPYILLIGWIPGVVGIAIGYVFTSIVKEEYLKPAMIIFGLFFVINTTITYVFIPFSILNFTVQDAITFSTATGQLPDATTSGFFRLLSIMTIVIMIATSIFFIITAVRTNIPLVKTRAGLLGVSLLLVALLITFDSIFPTEDIFILVGLRFFVVIGLFIMSLAIILPKRIYRPINNF